MDLRSLDSSATSILPGVVAPKFLILVRVYAVLALLAVFRR